MKYLVLALSLVASSSHAVTLADSVADFSGTQGGAGWTYSTYAYANDVWTPAKIQPVGYFRTITGVAEGTRDAWTYYQSLDDNPFLSAVGTHPASTVWTVRSWTSDYTGRVAIDLNLSRLQIGGDGETALVFGGDSRLGHWTLDDVTASATGTVYFNVAAGQRIDLVVDGMLDGTYDSLLTRAVIRTADAGSNSVDGYYARLDAVPEPGSIWAVGVGLGLVIRKRVRYRPAAASKA